MDKVYIVGDGYYFQIRKVFLTLEEAQAWLDLSDYYRRDGEIREWPVGQAGEWDNIRSCGFGGDFDG